MDVGLDLRSCSAGKLPEFLADGTPGALTAFPSRNTTLRDLYGLGHLSHSLISESNFGTCFMGLLCFVALGCDDLTDLGRPWALDSHML
ncbi:hypothetical protein CRG98_009749 [Punica granatum]|uniref:Uncharacterized protein n=1 Tax=Punica granatum TaxID=22663 RepID=A0A2I0KN18_PUNGR|nr:hypothetical protein CRG98_009749 [Punica granatum]